MQRGTRLEVSTAAFDEDTQIVGTDPYGSPYYVGLKIPPTPPPVHDSKHRYLFLLAYMRFGVGQKARLVGLRQMLTIAVPIAIGAQDDAAIYPLELPVESPMWHFVDGNVSWHLMRVPPNNFNNAHAGNHESEQFLMGETPALLFQTPIAAGYSPPNQGVPWGTPLVSDLGTFHDNRFPWNAKAWDSLDIEFQGPGGIAFFASVGQTDPETRGELVLPVNVPANSTTMQKEDAFVFNFPNSVYSRIAGSMIFEFPNEIPEPRDLIEKPHKLWKAPKEKKR